MSDINSVSMGPNQGGATSEFDQARAEKAVQELLIAIGDAIYCKRVPSTLC